MCLHDASFESRRTVLPDCGRAYRTQKWLTQKQFEDLITEVVTISRMRQFPGDAELVAAVLHDLGETDALEEALESLFQKQESDHLFS